MIDATASARYAAQRSILDNILGDDDIEEITGMKTGLARMKRLALQEIGSAFTYGDDTQLEALRQSIFDLDALTELIDRIERENVRVEENVP